MLGAAKAPDLFYQPLALGAGALWYGLVSLVWLWLLPYKTLHEQLAQSYFALSRYLLEKSRFFPADEHGAQAIRHNLAQLNINLVNALTLTKSALNARLSTRHRASPSWPACCASTCWRWRSTSGPLPATTPTASWKPSSSRA